MGDTKGIDPKTNVENKVDKRNSHVGKGFENYHLILDPYNIIG